MVDLWSTQAKVVSVLFNKGGQFCCHSTMPAIPSTDTMQAWYQVIYCQHIAHATPHPSWMGSYYMQRCLVIGKRVGVLPHSHTLDEGILTS